MKVYIFQKEFLPPKYFDLKTVYVQMALLQSSDAQHMPSFLKRVTIELLQSAGSLWL
jgi:hypothetical protein